MNTKLQYELDENDYELIQAAKETAEKLHVDNKHEVAAALRTTCGKIFTGIHIDANVGFADVCGEIAAMSTAISNGFRNFETFVAIWSDGKGKYVMLNPCGRCRELISDFSLDTWVIIGSLEKPYKMKITDLLPYKYVRSHEL